MKWIPIVLLFLLISAAQAKAGCVSITSPASGTSFIRGTNVLIKFSDTCSSRYFECLQIDGTNMVCSTPMPQQFNWATTTFSLGTHTVTIKSLDNGGAHLLGSASVPLTLVASTPTPKPTPSPTPKPTPSPTPVPASCISIVSPQPSQAIGGDFYFTTQDTCSGAWFESLFVDGLFVGDFSPNTIHWNTVAWVNGSHTVQVTSQSQNPGSRILGQTSESVEVKNVVLPTPTPTSKPTPSPTPGVTPTPKPSATPTPIAGCLHILSPADGSTVKLDFPLHTTDTCPSVQHEALVIDGAQVNEFIPNTEIVSSDDFPNGIHRVTIQAHLAEPPDMIVGSASVSYNFQNTFATPLPVPTSGPTPTAHFTTQPNSGPFADDSSTAPTDAQCEAVIPFKSETIVTNQAPHTDDLGMGISSAVNQTQARQSDLDRLAQFNYSFEQWSNYFWFKQITGKYTSTTWNIFRFSACKYGIDEDAIRAQATNENGSWSQWHAGGDRKTSLSLCQRQDVNLFGYICPSCCYQSWGDFQTKVFYEFMTWPMMEYSTDFSAEYRYAEQRACMNGDLTPYFSGRPEAGAYAADAAAYKNAPNSSSPHNFVNPVTGTLATNQDWMLFSCLSHHFSGSWNDSAANSYRTELLNHWKNHDWITPK